MSITSPAPKKEKKLLDQYSEVLRNLHYSARTEKTYISWVRKYILYHNKRHPREMGTRQINEFVTSLANQKNIAASTQNQAISAVLFLYRTVLEMEIILPPELINPSRPKRLPTVLTHAEAMSVINHMSGTPMIYTHVLQRGGLAVKSPLDS